MLRVLKTGSPRLDPHRMLNLKGLFCFGSQSDQLEGVVLHSVSSLAFYVDPGSGSMILQLLLGGVSGLYVIFRLFKQKILRALGIKSESAPPDAPALHPPAAPESEDPRSWSA